MNKLKIKQYITEDDTIPYKIFESLLEKQQVLLISAMKSGKTSFVMHYLANKFKELNIQLIFISPTRSLLDNVQSKYKVIKCNGDVKSIKLNNLIPIVSTPDSLPKAIEACELDNRQFILVYDEAHQVIENISFRDKLKNPFLIYENELCIALLAMTATPEPLENMHFDTRFYIEPKNKFYISSKTNIIKNFINNEDNMLAFLLEIKKRHKGKILFIRINNKSTIKLLRTKLSNCIAWYRADEITEGKQYKDDMDKFQEIIQGNDINKIDYILTSSLGDVVVEYLLN
ncbi:MAG: DEAD/DEAH box helicase family protein [Clostridium perfringens]|nr:DEAD/DEAH box helicase family protein [Clostridium perfringens]